MPGMFVSCGSVYIYHLGISQVWTKGNIEAIIQPLRADLMEYPWKFKALRITNLKRK
jgi:hypothetical protein